MQTSCFVFSAFLLRIVFHTALDFVSPDSQHIEYNTRFYKTSYLEVSVQILCDPLPYDALDVCWRPVSLKNTNQSSRSGVPTSLDDLLTEDASGAVPFVWDRCRRRSRTTLEVRARFACQETPTFNTTLNGAISTTIIVEIHTGQSRSNEKPSLKTRTKRLLSRFIRRRKLQF